MAKETVEEASRIIHNYMRSKRKDGLDTIEAVGWLRACANDGDERSWWLTIAIMTALNEKLFPKTKMSMLAGSKFNNLDNTMTVTNWGLGGNVALNKAYGALTQGYSYQNRVYVLSRGQDYNTEILWRGPARTPQAAMYEYPKELWQYRKEVEPACLGSSLWVWCPNAVFSVFDKMAHKIGFHPTADLRSVPEGDNLAISDYVKGLHKSK